MNALIAIACVLLLLAPSAGVQAQNDEPASAQALGTQQAAESYEEALIAYNLGETRTAYIHLRNALQEDPLLLPAHLLLGKIYLLMGEGEKAENQLLIADSLGAHRSLIQNSLARAYLMQGQPHRLVEELFSTGTSPDEDAELLALRGEALLDLQRPLDARRAFTRAWEMNPRSVAAILGRVRVMLMDGDLEQAVKLANDAVEIAPTNARAWYLKGILARSLGDLAGASSDFDQAAELLPSYLPAQIGRLGILLRLHRLDQADQVADQIREVYPKDPRSHYLEAVVQAWRGNPRAMETSLQEADFLISRLPGDLLNEHAPTLLLAGVVRFNLGQWGRAKDDLEAYLIVEPDAVGARVLLARIELEEYDRPERAIQLLEPLADQALGNVQALSLLTEAYMLGGQHLKAAQTVREALKKDPGDVFLRVQRAVNEFGLGRHDRSIEELVALAQRRPDLRNAGATLVVMQLRERNYAAAVESARELALRHPDNLTYINLFGSALSAADRFEAAQWAFELALAMDPGFFPARQNLAELLLQRGRLAQARGHLEFILDHHPREVGALMLLAQVYEAENEPERALAWAERALDADPGAVDVAIYQIDLLLELRRADEAVRVAEGIEVRAENPDDVELLSALGRAYIASARQATAQVVLRRGSAVAGYDARRLLEVAMLQREAGDLDGAIWSLRKAAEGDRQFLPPRMQLGEMLIELGRLKDAVVVVEELTQDFPQEPYADHLMGLIHRAEGDASAALESLRRAFAKKPSPLLAVRVYEALEDTDGVEAAVAFLEDWHAEHPTDGITSQTLAEGYYALGRTDEAVDLLEATLRQAPDNALLLNNLAAVYADADDPRALEHARRAYQLLPNAPEVADTLGWILVKQGELLEGLRYLRDAQTRAAEDAGISYHIAVALRDLGRTDEAIDELLRALRQGNAGPRERQRANELLTELRALPSG